MVHDEWFMVNDVGRMMENVMNIEIYNYSYP
jgi:hypothetical protein